MADDDLLVAARDALKGLRLPDGTALVGSDRVSGPVKVGDRLIDASVASQLRNMKNKMVAASRG